MPLTLKNFYKQWWGWPRPINWLIAYYPFDSDMNDHKADLWGTWTTYNCTQTSGTYSYWTWKVNNCLSQTVSGNSKAINTGISVGNVFSISVWFQIIGGVSWRTAIWWNQSTDEGYGFRRQFNNGNIWTWIRATIYTFWETITWNTWYQYTITQDWTELKQYLNWVLKHTDTVDDTAWQTTLKLCWRWDWYWTPVKFDDVLVYNRILTAEEISTYYNATA